LIAPIGFVAGKARVVAPFAAGDDFDWRKLYLKIDTGMLGVNQAPCIAVFQGPLSVNDRWC